MTTYDEARAALPDIPTMFLPNILAAWQDDPIVVEMLEAEIASRRTN